MGASFAGEGAKRGTGRRWRVVLALFGGLACVLAWAGPAEASFHEMKIREVYSGTSTNSSYLELQMYNPGQNFVSGHSVTIYDASAQQIGSSFTFSGSVANGEDQRTILVGDDGVQAAFGLTPDLVNSSFDIPAGGGAACFETIDCVAWGSFSGSVLSPVGTPEAAIPSGQAIRRSISGGACSGQLDPTGDDTNDSAADFSPVSPQPRNNASAILETECSPSAGPNTAIGTKPPTRTNSTTAEFTFTATPSAGASFECKLDSGTFGSCTSPKQYTELDGDNSVSGTAHKFEVRAKNAEGTDSTPATHSWTVDIVAPTTTITSQPADPSAGTSAKFNFTANETVTGFQCSLAKGAAADSFSNCTSGKTYLSLADDTYTFKVRATDQAGNQGEPDSYSWTVDNSLADTTPPETTIKSKPPDPSESATASFTYESNEPGSTFECKMDGAAFAACPGGGVTYSGLANGSHSFQVRAIDSWANKDESPAGYTWDVAVPSIQPPPVIPPAPPPTPQPETTITSKPGAVTRDRTPTFKFRSSVPGSAYECKLDRGAFRSCRSPFTTKALTFGPHVLQVRALAAGAVDPTPARSSFKVAKAKKRRRAR